MDDNLRQAIVNFLTQMRGLAPNPLSGIRIGLSSNYDYDVTMDVCYQDANGNSLYEELDDGGLQDLMLFLLRADIT